MSLLQVIGIMFSKSLFLGSQEICFIYSLTNNVSFQIFTFCFFWLSKLLVNDACILEYTYLFKQPFLILLFIHDFVCDTLSFSLLSLFFLLIDNALFPLFVVSCVVFYTNWNVLYCYLLYFSGVPFETPLRFTTGGYYVIKQVSF